MEHFLSKDMHPVKKLYANVLTIVVIITNANANVKESV